MPRGSRAVLHWLVLCAAGCASAGDRLAEGIELQGEGRYVDAAYRYADAIEKDGDLLDARVRFVAASDTAVMLAMESVRELRTTGDPISAAESLRRTDALLARGREVGMPIAVPENYGALRRQSFDLAIDALMGDAETLESQGRLGEARRALVRARSDFAGTSAQRDESVSAEVGLLLRWAELDLEEGHLKAAFAHAGEAVDMRPPPTRDVANRADALRSEALALGTLRLAVLTVTSRTDVRDAVGTDYQDELSDNLELDYWRVPPPFVAVADPVLVRREARDAGSGSRPLSVRQVRRVLDGVGADLGALIEVTEVEVTAENVRSDPRQSRDRNGDSVEWNLERGRYVVQVSAEVLIVDVGGAQIERFTLSGRGNGSFERGAYGGDVGELQLSRNELRYFDLDILDDQRAEARRGALEELAERLAGRVFTEVTRLVR